ncbi:TetR/AcrR family transcriptional regulator [Herbiconiux sp. 11R-BC]|uniref:TetR/AcrR family transcriptional regulator n=1 Tax=Herbiconiux sp. 11R-BC TaxID=3111637 RepID=UPI003C0D1885
MTENRRGPARSERARVAILEATARIFAARGYDHLTMEGIAAEAKVSKQTIYRWWPDRGALVADCLIENMLLPGDFVPPDTGDLRADLTSWLDGLFDFTAQPGGESIMRSLIAAGAENAEVGRRLNEAMGVTTVLVGRLRRAVGTGELRADAPFEEISEALMGAFIVRALTRAPSSPGVTGRLVTAVLGPAA